MASSYTRRITLYINGKEVRNDIATIRAEMNKLVNAQARMLVGSKEYTAAAKEISRLKAIINTHNQHLRATATAWDRIRHAAESVNRYFLMLSSAVMGLVGIAVAAKKAITMFAEFDDKVADVARTTGMAKDEIYAMNENLKKINTRTAQIDLMGLAVIAGKLGVPTKDVEGFVRAADKINVALGGALGNDVEQSINQIGKLVDIFNVSDKFGMEKGLLKVGSALTTIDNASTASSAYVVEFTKRVGGIAPIVDISIQNVMGLAATLDMLGQTSEVSSTVFSGVITGMFKKTAEYANIAGMNIEEFRKILNKDTNLAFIKVLEGLNGDDAGMSRMVGLMGDMGLEGKRAVQVLGVLSSNTSELRKQQTIANDAFNKGTSIMELFNTKNNSAMAILEKNRKHMTNMAIELGQKLMPALTVSTSGFSYFLKAVGIAFDFLGKYGATILKTAAILVIYTGSVKLATLWQKNFTAAKLKDIIVTAVVNTAQKAYIATLYLLQGVFLLLTGRIQKAKTALLAFSTVLKTSSWIGLLVTAISAAVYALVKYIQKINEASNIQKAMNEARTKSVELLIEEKTKVESLVKIVNAEGVSLATKKKAIDELKRIIPGYNTMLDATGKVIYNNTEAVKKYIVQLRRQYMLQAYQEQLGKASLDAAMAQDKKDQAIFAYNDVSTTDYSPGMKRPSKGSALGGLYDDIQEADKEVKAAEAVVAAMQSKVENTLTAMDDTKDKIQEAVKMILALKNTLDQLTGPNRDKSPNLKITDKAEKDLRRQLDYWSNKYLELTNQKQNPAPDDKGGNIENYDAGLTKDEISAAEKAAREREAAWKQEQDIKKQHILSDIELMKEGKEKELAELKQKYEEERDETKHNLDTNTKLTADEKKTLNKTLKNLDKNYAKDKKDIDDKFILETLKYEKDLLDLQLAATAKGSEQESSLKIQLINKNREIELAEIKETGDRKIALQKAINGKYDKLAEEESNIYINAVMDKTMVDAVRNLSQTKIAALQQLKADRDSGKISRKEYNRQLLALDRQYVQDSLQIAIDHTEAELLILQAAGEDITQAQAALDALKLEKQDADTNKDTTPNKENWTTEDTLRSSVDAAKQIADTIFAIKAEQNQRELDASLALFSSQREAELSSKYLTEKQKANINAKYDAKERAAKKAAWEKQHKADLASAFINLALMVGRAAINTWPFPAIPMMALAAVEGATQIALVASQKTPAFYEGGYTLKDNNPKKVAGVVHANEYVIPEQGLQNPKLTPFIQRIEKARIQGNLSTLNPDMAAASFRGFFVGGNTSSQPVLLPAASTPNAPPPSSDPASMQLINRMYTILDKLDKNGVRGKWFLHDLERIEKDKAYLESTTSL